MEPDNVVMGDASPTELPQMQPNEEDLAEEKNMARYSKTAEFQRIRQHCKERIKFYQSKLPNGLEVGLEIQPTAEDWRVANRVIGELKLLMNMYDVATKEVEAAEKAKKGTYEH